MRRRMRVAAISCASFVALLGFEMARMQSGNDPALARSKAVSAKRATSGTSKGSTGTQAGSDGSSAGSDSSQQGYDDGSGYGGGYDDQSGQSYDDQTGQSYGGSQGYYQPPQSDPPTTGSS